MLQCSGLSLLEQYQREGLSIQSGEIPMCSQSIFSVLTERRRLLIGLLQLMSVGDVSRRAMGKAFYGF